jgi:hypothetical protein
LRVVGSGPTLPSVSAVTCFLLLALISRRLPQGPAVMIGRPPPPAAPKSGRYGSTGRATPKWLVRTICLQCGAGPTDATPTQNSRQSSKFQTPRVASPRVNSSGRPVAALIGRPHVRGRRDSRRFVRNAPRSVLPALRRAVEHSRRSTMWEACGSALRASPRVDRVLDLVLSCVAGELTPRSAGPRGTGLNWR